MNTEAKQHYPLYKLFSEHGVDTFYIELLEKCPCHDIEELRKKEGEHIRELRPSLNKVTAGRKKKEYQAEHRENNKDYIRQLKHHYNKNNQDRILQYGENNREHINQTHKKHYEEVGKQPIECECGCTTTRKDLTRHRKPKKHNNLMNNTHYEQPVDCECGCVTTKPNLSRHRKSKKYMEPIKDKLN